jgi:hypothetical protein
MRAKHCGNSAKTWLGTLDTRDTRTKTNCEANGEDDGLLQRYYPPRRITPPPPSCRFKIIIAFLVDCTATILFALKDSNSHYMRKNDILYHFSACKVWIRRNIFGLARSVCLGGVSHLFKNLCKCLGSTPSLIGSQNYREQTQSEHQEEAVCMMLPHVHNTHFPRRLEFKVHEEGKGFKHSCSRGTKFPENNNGKDRATTHLEYYPTW